MKVTRKEIRRLKAQATALMEQASAVEEPVPETPEGRRRWWVKELQPIVVESFGPDDPRADVHYLNSLTQPQLHEVYQACVLKNIADWEATNPPELAAWNKLSVAEQVRILTNEREWDRFHAPFDRR